MVVLRQNRRSLLRGRLVADEGERIVERLARDLFEILVAFHRHQAEGVLELFRAPDLGRVLRGFAKVGRQVLPEAEWIDKRALHVECEDFWFGHRLNSKCSDAQSGDAVLLLHERSGRHQSVTSRGFDEITMSALARAPAGAERG